MPLIVVILVLPNLAHQGSLLGISPWVTFGSMAVVLALTPALMSFYAARVAARASDLVVWAAASHPHSSMFIVETTRKLRRLTSMTSDSDHRFWAMAVSEDQLLAWSNAKMPPAVILMRQDVVSASAEMVDLSTHTALGLRLWLSGETTPVDFGLHGLPGRLTFKRLSHRQVSEVARTLERRASDPPPSTW